MTTTTKTPTTNGSRKVGKLGIIALTATGVAAAAAGSYFFLSPKRAKERAAMKTWVIKAKADVLEKIEQLKDIDKDKYFSVIDMVMERYQKLQKAAPREIAELAKELKGQWQEIVKRPEAKGKSTTARKAAPSKRSSGSAKSSSTSAERKS